MSGSVADLTLQLLEKAETAARNGAYNLESKILPLSRIKDVRIIKQAIYWCTDKKFKLRELGVAILDARDDYDTDEILLLIDLSSNDDGEIRSWATYCLGSEVESDDSAVLNALFTRLDDVHHETRGEAMVGLAKRKVVDVFSAIERELTSDCVGLLAVEAAEELGDRRLLSALRALQDWWDVSPERLRAAIRACDDEHGA